MGSLNDAGWADGFRLKNGQDFFPLKNNNQKLSFQQESFFVS